MIRVVIDTNVLIRHLIRSSAAVRRLIEELWIGGLISMVSTPELVAELEAVLQRDKMRRFIVAADSEALLAALNQLAEMLPPLGEVPQYTRDPKDDKFVACALLGNVDYLVSLDQDLL
ncbi:MAG: putative toxin-antitoxin system toxin component, PIN family, partial [Caldilineaceae bacterium]|nr:putative toxin-antitoxin system toxin component, PIN family [Caldilineaceae bacterium]